MANDKAVALPVDVAMQEQERLTLLAAYHPHEHLMEWLAFDKGLNRKVPVIYYPAAWRLYELNLRYPNANFDSEIVHMDPAKDFVIVKARLYMGASYDASTKRASAFKQGKLSELDRVETKAKARAARDFGIGTEHALDMDDAEASSVGSTPSTNGRTVVEAVNERDRTQKPQPRIAAPAKIVESNQEQASENKPAQASQPANEQAPIPTVSKLREIATKRVGPNAFNAIVGTLQATYPNTDLKVDDAWEEKHCKHAYDLLKKQINEKKQSLAKAS